MASELLKLTAQIVMSHASMTELKPEELVSEIQEIYHALVALSGGEEAALPNEETGSVAPGAKPVPIPLKDIVKTKHVVCLECGRKMRTLKAHLRKTHNLQPKEYYRLYGLDPKKYPLVCKEYSEQRRKLAVEKGLGAGLRKKAD